MQEARGKRKETVRKMDVIRRQSSEAKGKKYDARGKSEDVSPEAVGKRQEARGKRQEFKWQ